MQVVTEDLAYLFLGNVLVQYMCYNTVVCDITESVSNLLLYFTAGSNEPSFVRRHVSALAVVHSHVPARRNMHKTIRSGCTNDEAS